MYNSSLGRTVQRQLKLIRNVEDGKGVPRTCGNKGNNAKTGACHSCVIGGVRYNKSQYFPSAVYELKAMCNADDVDCDHEDCKERKIWRDRMGLHTT